jgi:hypothetical protein
LLLHPKKAAFWRMDFTAVGNLTTGEMKRAFFKILGAPRRLTDFRNGWRELLQTEMTGRKACRMQE